MTSEKSTLTSLPIFLERPVRPWCLHHHGDTEAGDLLSLQFLTLTLLPQWAESRETIHTEADWRIKGVINNCVGTTGMS